MCEAYRDQKRNSAQCRGGHPSAAYRKSSRQGMILFECYFQSSAVQQSPNTRQQPIIPAQIQSERSQSAGSEQTWPHPLTRISKKAREEDYVTTHTEKRRKRTATRSNCRLRRDTSCGFSWSMELPAGLLAPPCLRGLT
jgi:hypothetical protein